MVTLFAECEIAVARSSPRSNSEVGSGSMSQAYQSRSIVAPVLDWFVMTWVRRLIRSIVQRSCMMLLEVVAWLDANRMPY